MPLAQEVKEQTQNNLNQRLEKIDEIYKKRYDETNGRIIHESLVTESMVNKAKKDLKSNIDSNEVNNKSELDSLKRDINRLEDIIKDNNSKNLK